MASIGSELLKARMAKGLTQEQAAAGIGISQEMVVQVENGKRKPSPATLAKIQRWMSSSANKSLRASRGPYNKDRMTTPQSKKPRAS